MSTQSSPKCLCNTVTFLFCTMPLYLVPSVRRSIHPSVCLSVRPSVSMNSTKMTLRTNMSTQSSPKCLCNTVTFLFCTMPLYLVPSVRRSIHPSVCLSVRPSVSMNSTKMTLRVMIKSTAWYNPKQINLNLILHIYRPRCTWQRPPICQSTLKVKFLACDS